MVLRIYSKKDERVGNMSYTNIIISCFIGVIFYEFFIQVASEMHSNQTAEDIQAAIVVLVVFSVLAAVAVVYKIIKSGLSGYEIPLAAGWIFVLALSFGLNIGAWRILRKGK